MLYFVLCDLLLFWVVIISSTTLSKLGWYNDGSFSDKFIVLSKYFLVDNQESSNVILGENIYTLSKQPR